MPEQLHVLLSSSSETMVEKTESGTLPSVAAKLKKVVHAFSAPFKNTALAWVIPGSLRHTMVAFLDRRLDKDFSELEGAITPPEYVFSL